MISNPFKIQEGTVRDALVKNFTAERNEGDSIIFSRSAAWIGKSLGNKSLLIFYVFLVFMILTLFFRAFYLEVMAGSKYLELAEGNRIKKIYQKAPRGIIYDRYGKALVQNNSNFYFYLDKSLLPEDQAERSNLITQLNGILNADVAKILEDAENIKLIAEKVDYDTALKLSILSHINPCLEVRLEPTRSYLKDYGLSATLGYIGQINEADLTEEKYRNYLPTDTLGKTGIEYQYENLLRGQDGYDEVETDALGRVIEEVSSIQPVKGGDLTLTIDLEMQQKLYNALTSISKDYNKPKSAGVVMNPKNGEILAYVSLPDYDNNLFTARLNIEEFSALINDENKPLFNRPISGEYPPGSTFKIIVASGALQKGIIDDKFTIMSVGGIDLNGFFFPDWRPGGHGLTNIYKAIADSVNTFFYITGGGDNNGRAGLGLIGIREYAQKFGLTKVLGIDLPGEAEGFVPSEEWKLDTKGERWYLGDTYNISIGQGDVLVTPLQVTQYTALIASLGNKITPHLLRANSDAEIVAPETPKVDWLSLDNLNIIKQALRRTVTDGSATSLQAVSVPVSGKTGTAQFSRDKTHSWFTGFAPYDDPELVVTVLVEEGGEQGLAVRAARLFLQSYYNN